MGGWVQGGSGRVGGGGLQLPAGPHRALPPAPPALPRTLLLRPSWPAPPTLVHPLLPPPPLQEKLAERGEAYLQFALLYSTTEGARRVRVHTLALPITQSLGTTFRGADLDAYMSYVSRKVASQVGAGRRGAGRLAGPCSRAHDMPCEVRPRVQSR